MVREWRPDVIAISNNYLANVPEVIELAEGGQGDPAGDVRLRGRPQRVVRRAGTCSITPRVRSTACSRGKGRCRVGALLEAVAERDARGLLEVPGIVTADGQGPAPSFLKSLEDLLPARDLLRHRRKYFIGVLDPCARSSSAGAVPGIARSAAPGRSTAGATGSRPPRRPPTSWRGSASPASSSSTTSRSSRREHGMAIGEADRPAGDPQAVLPGDPRRRAAAEQGGLPILEDARASSTCSSGIEAIDEDGLKRLPQAGDLSRNFEAIEFARSLGIMVAINIIADPAWDARQFEVIRQWCLEIPEIVNISVNTPYPGTETWLTESRRRDHARLSAVRHPARRAADPAPLARVLPASWSIRSRSSTASTWAGRRSSRWRGHPGRQPGSRADQHAQDAVEVQQRLRPPAPDQPTTSEPVRYEMAPPPAPKDVIDPKSIYVHPTAHNRARVLDEATQASSTRRAPRPSRQRKRGRGANATARFDEHNPLPVSFGVWYRASSPMGPTWTHDRVSTGCSAAFRPPPGAGRRGFTRGPKDRQFRRTSSCVRSPRPEPIPVEPAEHAVQFAQDWYDRLEFHAHRRMRELGIPEHRIGAYDIDFDFRHAAFHPKERTGGSSFPGTGSISTAGSSTLICSPQNSGQR